MSGMDSVADVIVKSLLKHGIDTVFAMPGDQLNHLFHALHRHRNAIRVIHPRHEQGAAYMAYGHARASGRPAVLIVPPGPGLLNALAGLSVAYATSTPVLCITGQVPSGAIGRRRGALHELPDQLATLRTLTAWAERIDGSASAEELVDQAFVRLLHGRPRPVALEVAPDILGAPARFSGLAQAGAAPADLPEAQLDRAAAMLREARRPLIIVGGGARQAAAAVRTLAQLLQAPVGSNSGGRGIVSERSHLALTWPAAHHLWAQADVVLAVGTRLSAPRHQWGLDDDMAVIRVDIDPDELADCRPNDLALLGDAPRLLPALAERCMDHRAASREAELGALKSTMQTRFAAVAPQQAYIDAIRAALPDDAIIVDELTQIGYACRYGLPVHLPGTYITSGYQGALGYGFPTAIGAKAAFPERVVLSINGDGGFLYAAAELATAVQQGLGVIVLVFNDGAFGNIARDQHAAGYSLACELGNPDFPAFAASFGARVAQADGPAGLRQVIEEARRHAVPTVIEIPVGPMPSPWHLIRLPAVRHASLSRPN